MVALFLLQELSDTSTSLVVPSENMYLIVCKIIVLPIEF